MGIAGRYVVTTIDGKSPVINIVGHEPTVTITGSRVHFQSQCIYADWTLEKAASGRRAKRATGFCACAWRAAITASSCGPIP